VTYRRAIGIIRDGRIAGGCIQIDLHHRETCQQRFWRWRVWNRAILGGTNEAVQRAQSMAAMSQDLIGTTPVTIAAGRVESALGHKPAAAALFRTATEQARRADTMSLVLETRLAIAETAVKNGDPAARKQLTELAADSAQRGYGLFAGRAQKLLSSLK